MRLATLRSTYWIYVTDAGDVKCTFLDFHTHGGVKRRRAVQHTGNHPV